MERLQALAAGPAKGILTPWLRIALIPRPPTIWVIIGPTAKSCPPRR